jgi:hypothetical protein
MRKHSQILNKINMDPPSGRGKKEEKRGKEKKRKGNQIGGKRTSGRAKPKTLAARCDFPATFLTFTSNNTFCEAVRWLG